MAFDYTAMETAIADELSRSDLTTQIALAILRAIRHYQKRDWWFLDQVDTASTVASQKNYAYPSDFRSADHLKITCNGWSRQLVKRTWAELDELYVTTTHTGQPSLWADYQSNIWLYPIPNAIYTLTLSFPKILTALSAGSDSNSFTDECEELIRFRSKWDLYLNTIRDPGTANLMKQGEAQALVMLDSLHANRVSAGIRPYL